MQATTQARGRTGFGWAPGTCGELVQGILPSGQRFQVTCPIDRGSRVTVSVTEAEASTVEGLAPGMWKTRRALELAAELLELGPARIVVHHGSDLPQAKGLASSTADIVAAVRALANACGTPLSNTSTARLAASVEPTDGLMFPGLAAVDHHRGEPIRDWSWWPQYAVAMFSPAARRETGRTGAPASPALAGDYAELLSQLDDAVDRRDALAFAAPATRSAQLNQSTTPNPLVPFLLPELAATGAAGLCVGHSGTVCGLLFHGAEATAQAGAAAADLLPFLPRCTTADVVFTPASPS